MARLEALCGRIRGIPYVRRKRNFPPLAARIDPRARGVCVAGGKLPGRADHSADLVGHLRKEEEPFPAAIRAESDFFRKQGTPEEKEVAG